MKKQNALLFIGLAIIIGCSSINIDSNDTEIQQETTSEERVANENIKLGAFSMSLNVKDLKVSKLFYENLGFTVLGGDLKMNYLIMKNENSLIGLFQGMFENNIITFNPGWDENGENIEEFEDVRVIQERLKGKGIKLDSEADPSTTGPASVVLTDPDGNVIFIDQHR